VRGGLEGGAGVTPNNHGDREHSEWSASATARNMTCAGAITMEALAPPKVSRHADMGTAVHQISERCLRDGGDAIRFLDTIEDAKTSQIPITEELVESAQTYIDYVRSRAEGLQHDTMLEQKFSLADLNPPLEAGGTGDAVLYDAKAKLLEIVDLKNGTSVVEANGNAQLRTYAVGALLANRDLDVEQIRVTIVQPRAFHKQGPIRSETFHVADLIDWTSDLVAAMHRAAAARSEHEKALNNSVLLDEWHDKWLQVGACDWCDAKGFCPKQRKAAIDRKEGVAKVWFEDVTDEPKISNTPETMSPEELARTLDLLPMLEDWIKATRGYAHALADAGTEIPGYFLADKIGNRKWAAEDAKVVSDLRDVIGLSDDEIFEAPKLRSVAQVEKVLGAKRKAEISSMWLKPVTGVNLVSEKKTTRTPAKSAVDKYFEEN
jgi:hypothetical protein